MFLDGLGDDLQTVVTKNMAVLIVDLFEEVDIDHIDRERLLRPPRPVHLVARELIEELSVVGVRERIGMGSLS